MILVSTPAIHILLNLAKLQHMSLFEYMASDALVFRNRLLP